MEAENDDETNVGTVTIEIPDNVADGNTIRLTGVRTDVSSLAAGDDIIGTISSSAPTGLIPIGQSRSATVSAVVAEVKAGLEVGISPASRLICTIGTEEEGAGGTAAITVTEGFASAWEDRAHRHPHHHQDQRTASGGDLAVAVECALHGSWGCDR